MSGNVFQLCHEIAARSLVFNGEQLPLCARCTGIVSFFVIGCLVGLFLHHFWWGSAWRLTNKTLLISTLISAFCLALNGMMKALTPYIGIWADSNVSRLILGGILGVALSHLFIALLLLNLSCALKRDIRR